MNAKELLKTSLKEVCKPIGPYTPYLINVSTHTTLAHEVEKQKRSGFESFYLHVHPSQQMDRITPVILHSTPHWKFKAPAVGLIDRSPSTYIGNIFGARVFSLKGIVLNDRGELVGDVSAELARTAQQHTILKQFKIAKPILLKGRSLLLSGPGPVNNFFHWLTDVLPKIEIAKKAGIDITAFDHLIVNSKQLPFQEASCKLMRIAASKFVSLTEVPYVQCEELVVTSPTCSAGNPSPWIIDFLREYYKGWMKEDDRFNDRKIFISRKKATVRRMLNEEALWEKLSSVGFEKFYLEELSLEEQVRLFSNAKTIVGPHGAGLTNICFSKPGTKVIEIFPPSLVQQSFWVISSHLNLKYHYVMGQGIDESTPHNHIIDGDISLSQSQIDSIVEAVA